MTVVRTTALTTKDFLCSSIEVEVYGLAEIVVNTITSATYEVNPFVQDWG